MKQVEIGKIVVGNDRPLTLIAGPCQLQTRDHAHMIAGRMAEICDRAGAQYVFKASFDKANRTSLKGKRGTGIAEGLEILQSVRDSFGCPVLTDIHTEAQCAEVAQIGRAHV